MCELDRTKAIDFVSRTLEFYYKGLKYRLIQNNNYKNKHNYYYQKKKKNNEQCNLIHN